MSILGVIGCILGFLIVIYLCYKDWSVYLATFVGTCVVIACNTLPFIDSLVGNYVSGMFTAVKGFFFMILFGCLQSKIYTESGAAYTIADTVMNLLLKENMSNTGKNLIAMAVILVIGTILNLGGIIAGVFTATEGSVVAVVYSLVLSLVFYKSIKLKDLPKIFIESAEMTGIIIFLIGVSGIMSWVMAFTNIPEAVSAGMLAISSSKIVILLLINIILLVVGTFMDMTPAVLIFTPIFLPICEALGMNMIHFGIMMIFNLCIGTITPPVGTTLFVGVKVGGVKIETVIRQLLVYFAAIFIVLLLVTYIPQLSLWLPSLMGYV